MTYTLANIDGRAALVADDRCHDLGSMSDGELGSQGEVLAVVTTHIEDIGTLANRCVRSTDHRVC